MLQSELNEISDAFSEAWNEFFGQEMFYVKLSQATEIHPLYGEAKKKLYDFENKVSFNGTFKQKKYEERGEINGRDNYEEAEITFVTKELYEKGITNIVQSSVIEIIHRNGERKLYNIISNYGKVQLGNNKIFTTLEVTEITNFDWSDYK